MAAPRRTPFEIEQHRHTICSLYLRGMTQAAIAERLGITREMVTYDVRQLQIRWRRDTAMDLDAAKTKELARIDELERTYWTAWESSLQDKEVSATMRRQMAAGQVDQASIRKEARDGNPAFLAGVLNCIDRRCHLLGLDAPVKVDMPPLGFAELAKEVQRNGAAKDTVVHGPEGTNHR